MSSFLDSGSHCVSDCKDLWNELLLSEQPDTCTNPHLQVCLLYMANSKTDLSKEKTFFSLLIMV